MAQMTIAPGTRFPSIKLTAFDSAGAPVVGSIQLKSLANITVSNANEFYKYSSLDSPGQYTIPTIANNEITTQFFMDETLMLGTDPTGDSASELGVLGLSDKRTKCAFVVDNLGTKTITGNCYVGGISMATTPTEPIWQTPITFGVDGPYKIV